jgi:hypothetical protein
MLRIVLTLLLFQQMDSVNVKNIIKLQNIITSSAIMSAVTKRVNSELINESVIINEVTNVHSKNEYISMILTPLFIALLFSQYDNIKKFEKKFVDIELYSETRKKTNLFILIVLYVFTRNVENAI